MPTSREYQAAALAKARKDGLTSGDVLALGYQGIAALAEVEIEANGNSPAEFFYVSVRHKVHDTLWREELAAADAAMEAVVRAQMTMQEEQWLDGKLAAALSISEEVSDGL